MLFALRFPAGVGSVPEDDLSNPYWYKSGFWAVKQKSKNMEVLRAHWHAICWGISSVLSFRSVAKGMITPSSKRSLPSP